MFHLGQKTVIRKLLTFAGDVLFYPKKVFFFENVNLYQKRKEEK